MIKNERDDYQQEINDRERFLKAKRQDLASLQDTENSLRTEVDSLQRENAASTASMENKISERKLAHQALEQKKEHIGVLNQMIDNAKSKFVEERTGTNSKEKIAESIEKSLADRGKALQQANKNITNLKNKMYNDSLRLSALRKRESDLISGIHGAQANIKNFSSKLNELGSTRTKQQEILYNANFQLQQMEKKVSRGLGERSTEEQQKLKSRIDDLEKELCSERQKKGILIQQQRKLQAELRSWNKKYDVSDLKFNETVQRIEDVGLEICSCELSLKDMVSKKEEAMVSHDVTLLDVRRLRDALRNLLEEVCSLKQQNVESTASIQEKKEMMIDHTEVKMAQLRSSKEEHHKAAIELGKMRVTLDKIKSKYEIVSAANAGKGEGEGFESPEYKLILAAQKREELQQDGDKLDETIQNKENEIRTMKKTLAQLRDRNTNFRSSFSKADINGAKAQELQTLEQKGRTAEENLFKTRKELQVLQKSLTEDKLKLDHLIEQVASHEEKNGVLLISKAKFECEVERCKAVLDDCKEKISTYRESYHRSKKELQHKKFTAELVQIQSDRICLLLLNLGEEFPELRDDIQNDMKKMGLKA